MLHFFLNRARGVKRNFEKIFKIFKIFSKSLSRKFRHHCLHVHQPIRVAVNNIVYSLSQNSCFREYNGKRAKPFSYWYFSVKTI